MGFSVMLRGAETLVPAEYWCPYGTLLSKNKLSEYSLIYGVERFHSLSS